MTLSAKVQAAFSQTIMIQTVYALLTQILATRMKHKSSTGVTGSTAPETANASLSSVGAPGTTAHAWGTTTKQERVTGSSY